MLFGCTYIVIGLVGENRGNFDMHAEWIHTYRCRCIRIERKKIDWIEVGGGVNRFV
jgi:hypothetical protein